MIIDLGLVDYEKVLCRQKKLAEQRRRGEIGDTIVFAEHPSVFTIGKTGIEKNLLADENELNLLGIKLVRADRGGDITYHGPGQQMIYPIIRLCGDRRDLHAHMRWLEGIAIGLLKVYDISAHTVPGMTGVWVNDAKIASIGIGSSDWVTYHGMSINVNTDLSYFSMINPCGMKIRITSMEKILDRRIPMRDVKECLANEFNTRTEAAKLA